MNWTAADLAAAGYGEDGRRIETRVPRPVKTHAPARVAAAAGESPAPNKYRNQPTVGQDPWGDACRYSSKKEAARARALRALAKAGEITDWYPQVSIPYGIDEKNRTRRYVADFMIVHGTMDDGRLVVSFEDVKGRDTPASIAKRAALRARGLSVTLT